MTLHFRDRCGVASLRYRHRAEITVLTWPIRYDFHTRRKRFPVQCEHRLIGSQVAWVASVSVRFRSNKRGTEVNDHAKNGAKMASPSPLFYFLALVSFLERSKPRIPFLGLSLLRNQTETLATQARNQGTSQESETTRMFNWFTDVGANESQMFSSLIFNLRPKC